MAINFANTTLAWTLPWDAAWVTAVTFVGSPRRLAAGNNLGQILVWDLPEKPGAPAPPYRLLDGHTNVISRLVATADGSRLISASYDHTIRYWDLRVPATGGSTTLVLNRNTREDLLKHYARQAPRWAVQGLDPCLGLLGGRPTTRRGRHGGSGAGVGHGCIISLIR